VSVRRIALLVLLWWAGAALPAHAGETTPPRGPIDSNAISSPATLDGFPEAHRLNGLKARAIASVDKRIQKALKQYPKAQPEVYLKGQTRWQIGWFTPGSGSKRREIAQVIVDDATGKVTEAWTGPYVAWTMARGYPGAFGHKVNAPWVWISLTVLFLLPFFNPRKLRRWLHLDLLVLAGLGVSVAYFNDARLDVAVPIIGPLLSYLLVRALVVAFSRRNDERPREPLALLVPVSWLVVVLVFLVGFRVGLNIKDSNVIDVGYSGVIGADYLSVGKPLYGEFPKDNGSGDTYGPFAYEAYIPFEQAFPWTGRWNDLWAAHAAAITFDLLTIITLLGIGWRIRGPGMGVVMAYAWTAWPFSLYAMNCNSNDALVALMVALTLLVAAKPAARGFLAVVGSMTKFVSLILLPLFATHQWHQRRFRTVALYSLGALLAAALVWSPVILGGESLSTVFERTVKFQFGRDAPFSFWGYYDFDTAQLVWQAAVVLLALAMPLLPRRRDVVGLAGAAAALLIAAELSVTYWFYLYLVWFFPPLIVGLFGRYDRPARVRWRAAT